MNTVVVVEVVEGPQGIRGRRVAHKGIPLVIGRAPQADLTLADSKVSKNHAVIELRGNSYYLVDLESLNGTVLNGERIIRPEGAKLQHGDDIVIAGYHIKFYIFAGLGEGEFHAIQKRITMNTIQKYSNKSAALYVEIPKFRELYTKYETKEVDDLRDRFVEEFKNLVHEGAPYYAQPMGERALAFFDAGLHAIEFGRELMRRIERLNLNLLRDAKAAIKKMEIRIGVDEGPLSVILGDDGRIEQATGALTSRGRQIAQEASGGELMITEKLFDQIPEKVQPSWTAVKTDADSKLGNLFKYQSDTTAQL